MNSLPIGVGLLQERLVKIIVDLSLRFYLFIR